MACIATDVAFPVGELHVDFARHRKHHARGSLHGIVVASEIALHMAESALDAQRRTEGPHSVDELRPALTLQDLKVLGRRHRTFLAFFFLGADADGDEQQNYH